MIRSYELSLVVHIRMIKNLKVMNFRQIMFQSVNISKYVDCNDSTLIKTDVSGGWTQIPPLGLH
jgi:hypothetical protein